MRQAGTHYDWRALALLAAACAAGMVAMSALAHTLGPDFVGLALRDPLAVARSGDDVRPVHVGWLSHLGIVLWGAAAAFALVGARLRRRGRRARVLLAGGLLGAGLMADDLLLLHEQFAPVLLGVDEAVVQAFWAASALVWVVASRRELGRSRHLPLLLLALGLLALVVVVDVFVGTAVVRAEPVLGAAVLAEDGVKLLGIAAWATFFWRFGITDLLEPADGADDGDDDEDGPPVTLRTRRAPNG